MCAHCMFPPTQRCEGSPFLLQLLTLLQAALALREKPLMFAGVQYAPWEVAQPVAVGERQPLLVPWLGLSTVGSTAAIGAVMRPFWQAVEQIWQAKFASRLQSPYPVFMVDHDTAIINAILQQVNPKYPT